MGYNSEKAKLEADKIDGNIIETLQSGKSFLVEAGAGSGKTYSLNKVIEWLQENKWAEFKKKKQNVICVTYTNVAVDVIALRLKEKSFILPSTIHSFAWNAIKQYQSKIIQLIIDNVSLHPKEGDLSTVNEVKYSLGHRYIEDDILHLHHNDVIVLFGDFLDNGKFRKVFADKYPLILIDEYQDSFKSLIDRFINYFVDKNTSPQFGFFGDSWQTIYQMNKTCGLIQHNNLETIKKVSNFRSAKNIVDLLNKIRPDLPQITAIDDFEGEVFAIHCNDFTGQRRTDGIFGSDLPPNEITRRIKLLKQINKGAQDSVKVLMITHKVLAAQQGYDQLLEILGDRFKDENDTVLLFFMKIVEPIFKALSNSDMVLLFQTLGIKKYPINSKSEKKKWQDLKNELIINRDKLAIDIIRTIGNSKIVPIPPDIENLFSLYSNKPETIYVNSTVKNYLDLPYVQFISAMEFLYPEAEFSTEHGVKGEEYDNVIFTIGKGWNNYQFNIYAPMINSKVPDGKQDSFERNRNLFYVCCSRPRKRLIIFVTIPTDKPFEEYLKFLVGNENYYSYEEYISKFK